MPAKVKAWASLLVAILYSRETDKEKTAIKSETIFFKKNLPKPGVQCSPDLSKQGRTKVASDLLQPSVFPSLSLTVRTLPIGEQAHLAHTS